MILRRVLPILAVAALRAASLAAPLAAPLAAQHAPRVEIQLPTPTRLTSEGPLVRAAGVLSDERMRELLRSGFPAHLHFRVELWSSERWFDQLHRTAEWDVVVSLRGVDQMYEVMQVVGDRQLSLGAFARIEDAEAAVERPVRVPITAPASDRRFYYKVELDVETLSMTDLDEVSRWLRGELQPAVRGRRNPGTAFTRGLRSLTSRILGGERREYGARSATFRPPNG
ncbi:MAG: hypothetical protein WD771_08945 [Gemmatimonadaceae bacterium]